MGCASSFMGSVLVCAYGVAYFVITFDSLFVFGYKSVFFNGNFYCSLTKLSVGY